MRKTSYSLKKPVLLMTAVLMSGLLFAQPDTAVWTGAVDTDAGNLANWDPQLAIDGKVLVIDSVSNIPNQPVFTGSDSVEVANVVLNPTAVLTLQFDDSLILFDVTEEYFQPHGTINIMEGTLRGRRCHIEDTNSIVNIESGGLYVVRKYFFMSGDGNNRPTAGFINIEGTGKAIYDASQGGAFGRFPTDTTTGVITLEPFGTLDLKGNWVNDVNNLIASGQIMAGTGYDVVVKYDEAGDWTYVSVRDKLAFVIEPIENQFIVTGEAGSKIGMVQNDGYAATSTFDWQYSTTSGSGYTSFSPAVTTDSIEAVFDTPGKYFVVCVGDGSKTSNEVIFFVGSDKVSVDPPDQQYLRVDKDGAMLSVETDAVITSVEWKYSSTPGEGHVSFDPPATGTEFTPNFDTEGLYYIICEGKDAGDNLYPSKDVKIKVDNSRYNITWNGSGGIDANLASNWDPHANVDGNTIYINDPGTYTDSLVFSGGNGNQTIDALYLNDTLSTMTVDMGDDTLIVSNHSYGIAGQLIVTSGVLSYRDLRHERQTGRIIVKGTGEFLIRSSYFINGSSGGSSGSFIDIMDDGRFVSIENQPFEGRWAVDTTLSVITITGNGLLQVPKDWRGGAEKYMGLNQLKVPDPELEELVVTWPVLYEGDTVTQITAKSLLVFDIDPLDDQLVGVGDAVSEVKAINDAEISSYEWMYSETSGGPYTSFDPAETGSSFTGSFDAAGVYYVVCVGDGTETSSEFKVTAVSVEIAPTDAQELVVNESGTDLTVTESQTADSREWMSSTTSGSGYTALVPPQSGETLTPLFTAAGTYYVVCASTFGSTTVISNEVMISVATGIDDNMANTMVMYPNPAKGYFNLKAGEYSRYHVTVSSLSGQVVFEREFDHANGYQRIELDRTGVYFVQVRTEDGVRTLKLIMK